MTSDLHLGYRALQVVQGWQVKRLADRYNASQGVHCSGEGAGLPGGAHSAAHLCSGAQAVCGALCTALPLRKGPCGAPVSLLSCRSPHDSCKRYSGLPA